MDQFARTKLLLGEEAMEKLRRARVAVFGIGGVGGYVCEALVRSGIGAFDLVDSDTVSITNLNRQIIATLETVGRPKAEVMAERMRSINPQVQVTVHNCFFLPENAADFPFEEYDYVVDAVDTVTAKLAIIERARQFGVPVISAMGAGNKLDPSRFQVSDISQTSICPLARVMRKELKKRGIEHLKVVWSDEPPRKPFEGDAAARPAEGTFSATGGAPEGATAEEGPEAPPPGRRALPGSVAFVPAVCGLVLAGEVVKDLAGIK